MITLVINALACDRTRAYQVRKLCHKLLYPVPYRQNLLLRGFEWQRRKKCRMHEILLFYCSCYPKFYTTLLSDFNLVCSIAMKFIHSQKTRIPDSSHPYLDWCFGCGYEILHKRQGYVSPLQSCASSWRGGVTVNGVFFCVHML